MIFRLSRPFSCKNQEYVSRKQWSLHAFFLQRSSSFSLASASRVHNNNESWQARQRAYTYLTNTYNLNSYDNRTRPLADVLTHTKRVPQRCWSIAFDFPDLSSSNLLHESSIDLRDNVSKNALSWPQSLKSEACPTLRCISLGVSTVRSRHRRLQSFLFFIFVFLHVSAIYSTLRKR